jgi:hypothetical protein
MEFSKQLWLGKQPSSKMIADAPSTGIHQIANTLPCSSTKSKPNPTLIQSAEFATSQFSLLEALSSPGDAHCVVFGRNRRDLRPLFGFE